MRKAKLQELKGFSSSIDSNDSRRNPNSSMNHEEELMSLNEHIGKFNTVFEKEMKGGKINDNATCSPRPNSMNEILSMSSDSSEKSDVNEHDFSVVLLNKVESENDFGEEDLIEIKFSK
jgi:hypothetical protein